MDANELYREIAKLEALIASDESKGKRTALKAAHLKLSRQYFKAIQKGY